jgi:hypothetical protein
MRALGVDPKAAHVSTITSLAFDLVRSYSRIAGLTVPEVPVWKDAGQYIEGACRVLRNRHIRDVFGISYRYLLVDEYQDCSLAQHAFVLELAQAIPACAVFGDPLQGIFGFRDKIVDWQTDVLPHFPPFCVDFIPYRWIDHNRALGEWLVQIRDYLKPGSQIAFHTNKPTGVTFRLATSSRFELRKAATLVPKGETAVVIAPPDKYSARLVASRLDGYVTMEDVGGVFMLEQLTKLQESAPEQYALWLAKVAKACFTGYAKLNQPVLNRLRNGDALSDLKSSRDPLTKTLDALESVLASPTFEALSAAMRAIENSREARLHSREAWNDMATALERCSSSGRSPAEELGRVRDRLRHSGRRPVTRVVSRTTLIKGLEYDHVIISDLDRLNDHCNLYVALTRARKTITLIGSSSQITVKETKRGPSET